MGTKVWKFYIKLKMAPDLSKVTKTPAHSVIQ